MIDISGLDKKKVINALYKYSKPLGLGILHYREGDTVRKDILEEIIESKRYIDYLEGRVMKVDVFKDQLSTGLYDRDNGPGMALFALQEEGLIK